MGKDESNERDWLDLDFFAGDRDDDSRELKNRIRTARKVHRCGGFECRQAAQIRKGERYRSLVMVTFGELHEYKWCRSCLETERLEWA